MTLQDGDRVCWQGLIMVGRQRRFGPMNLQDRGTVRADEHGVLAVLWDDGTTADEITPGGAAESHAWHVRKLPRGVPDVQGRPE